MKNHKFIFNPHSNGGEQIVLESEVIRQEGENPYLLQTLNLNCYERSVSFSLSELIFTPNNLRKLADELEKEMQ